MKVVKNIFMILLFALLGVAASVVVYQSGIYLSGVETFGYLYKGDLLAGSIMNGNPFPLMDFSRFGGMEFLRFSSPIPVLLMALCQMASQGSPVIAYLIFVGVLQFLSCLVWYFLGVKYNRSLLGAFVGVVYLIIPVGLKILFVDGNLGLAMAYIILPAFMGAIHGYFLSGKTKELIGISIDYCLIVLCDYEFAIIVAVSTLIVVIIECIVNGYVKRGIHVLFSCFWGQLISGIWSISALNRYFTLRFNENVMKEYFRPLRESFNPMSCLSADMAPGVYLGISLVIICVLGIILARKMAMPYFVTALLIMLLTGPVAFNYAKMMPFKNLLFMLKYMPFAAAAAAAGFLFWRTLKKPFVAIICVIMLLEAVAGVYGFRNVSDVCNIESFEDEYLLRVAKSYTRQRLLMMDDTKSGAMATYLLARGDDAIAVETGYEWEDAPIASNFLQLSEAYDGGYYRYFFDRCLSSGDDSVLINIKDYVPYQLRSLDVSASLSGYKLIAESDTCRLYHLDTFDTYGVISEYDAIGIGNATGSIALDFPCMEETIDTNLNNYTFSQLSKYDLIFLDGFTFTDAASAEDMILRLAQSGVKIVIAADGMPIDEHTGIQRFLGVTCSTISFHNGYPMMQTIDGDIYPDLFAQGYSDWKTVYVNGLEDVWGTITVEDKDFNFYGTAADDNIVFIGLNLTYHYGLTKDEAVGNLLSHAITISSAQMPRHKFVKLNVGNTNDKIVIVSEEDNVNTTLSYQMGFLSDQQITNKNNHVEVYSGKTTIIKKYAYLWEGVASTLFGIFALALMVVMLSFLRKRSMISEVAAERVNQPEAFTKVKSGVDIQEENSRRYVVESSVWKQNGEPLADGSEFPHGTVDLEIVFRALRQSTFTNDVAVTVGNIQASNPIVTQRGKLVKVSIPFGVREPFKLERQPKMEPCEASDPAVITWKVNDMAKLGYIQAYENDSWKICGVIESGAAGEGEYTFASADRDDRIYRLVFVLRNGSYYESDSFTISQSELLQTKLSQSDLPQSEPIQAEQVLAEEKSQPEPMEEKKPELLEMPTSVKMPKPHERKDDAYDWYDELTAKNQADYEDDDYYSWDV